METGEVRQSEQGAKGSSHKTEVKENDEVGALRKSSSMVAIVRKKTRSFVSSSISSIRKISQPTDVYGGTGGKGAMFKVVTSNAPTNNPDGRGGQNFDATVQQAPRINNSVGTGVVGVSLQRGKYILRYMQWTAGYGISLLPFVVGSSFMVKHWHRRGTEVMANSSIVSVNIAMLVFYLAWWHAAIGSKLLRQKVKTGLLQGWTARQVFMIFWFIVGLFNVGTTLVVGSKVLRRKTTLGWEEFGQMAWVNFLGSVAIVVPWSTAVCTLKSSGVYFKPHLLVACCLCVPFVIVALLTPLYSVPAILEYSTNELREKELSGIIILIEGVAFPIFIVYIRELCTLVLGPLWNAIISAVSLEDRGTEDRVAAFEDMGYTKNQIIWTIIAAIEYFLLSCLWVIALSTDEGNENFVVVSLAYVVDILVTMAIDRIRELKGWTRERAFVLGQTLWLRNSRGIASWHGPTIAIIFGTGRERWRPWVGLVFVVAFNAFAVQCLANYSGIRQAPKLCTKYEFMQLASVGWTVPAVCMVGFMVAGER